MAKKANQSKNVTNTANLSVVPQVEEVEPVQDFSHITLEDIAATGIEGMYLPQSVYQKYLDLELVEIYAQYTNEQGLVPTRLTAKGRDYMRNKNASAVAVEDNEPEGFSEPEEQPSFQTATPTFAIEDNIPVPQAAPGLKRGRANIYPFDQLQVGQSFFVPNTNGKTNMAKALASTVSSATMRYAVAEPGQFKLNSVGDQVPVMRKTRIFVIRNVQGGARIWRQQ